jgi:subtilisin family serine protease
MTMAQTKRFLISSNPAVRAAKAAAASPLSAFSFHGPLLQAASFQAASFHAGGPLGGAGSARPFAVAEDHPVGAEAVKTTLGGRKVVEMAHEGAAQLAAANPDLIIEEDVPLRHFQGIPGLLPTVPTKQPFALPVRVLDDATGQPIPNATVYGLANQVTYQSKTDTDAAGLTVLDTSDANLRGVLVSPRDGYWSRALGNIIAGSDRNAAPLEVRVKALPVTGGYEWGHTLMGFPAANRKWTGRGVKIAIVDSGLAQHPDLTPAGGINLLVGEDEKAWTNDLEGHGTHCAGIVAGQQKGPGGIFGGAPNADIYSIRVFPGGFLSDLVEAVEWCILHKIDVVSLSLGMSDFKQQLFDVFQQGAAQGMTFIAATGNDGGAVAYPAAFPGVIAVGAIGQLGTFPSDSGHVLKIGPLAPTTGGLFAASFTNFGPQVTVCAPGVAIRSTVPTGYAAWDGTSMACPMVAAVAALVLEAYPQIRTGNTAQSDAVRWLVSSSAVSLGLDPVVQGRGLPYAGMVLPS